jgi:HSP20 family molecular chaperone IbpA
MSVELETKPEVSQSKKEKIYLRPLANINESVEEIQLIIDMPGVDEKSLNINLEDEILSITGEAADFNNEGYRPLYIEFKTGIYQRKFQIQKPIDFENSKAVIKNGRLTLILKKLKPEVKKINIATE